MNFKDHERIVVLNSPEEFKVHIEAMKPFTKMSTSARVKEISYVLIFAKSRDELSSHFIKIKDKFIGDALLWVCFPKKSSKKYKSSINRDEGWELIGAADFEPVKIVAIDEDWSALRFRKVVYIKQLKRNDKMLISKGGKAKKKRQ